MEFVLILFVIGGGVYSQRLPFATSQGTNAGYISYVDIGEKYISEIKCIKKLQNVVEARLIEELNNVPINDADNLSKIPWEERESNFTKYNTYEDEWLMEDGSPVKKIEQCVQHLLSDIIKNSDELNKNDVDCINEMTSEHALHESYHRRDLINLINSTSSEQLPFRKFINFPQIADLIFQNRQLSDWTSIEALLYGHTESYVVSDADRIRPNYIVTQNCDWVKLKALQDTPNELEMLREFKSQVINAVYEQLAATLMRNWNLNKVLPKDRYSLWLKSHQDMIIQLETVIDKLRNQPKDAIMICKYAKELAKNLTDVQSAILLTSDDDSPMKNFYVFDSTPDIRIIEQQLAAVNDFRYPIVKKIADRQEYEIRCLSSFYRLVENHRRYEIAMEFIDEEYEFAEIYCKKNKNNPGLIQFIFCNCIGTICVAHDLTALFEEEYVLVKGSDGGYKIVRSGIKSKRKVTHCHTLANSSRN